MPIITDSQVERRFRFEPALMTPTTEAAAAAMHRAEQAAGSVATPGVLEEQSLLVIDNRRAAHSRSPFTARFDGSDRWLRRMMVGAADPCAGTHRGAPERMDLAVVRRENIDQTVADLLDAQGGNSGAMEYDAAKKRVADAESVMRRHQAAILAGVDPTSLVEVINAAQAEREAAYAALAGTNRAETFGRAEAYAMIDAFGDVEATLADAKPAGLTRLYEKLRLQLRYEPQEQAI